MAVTYGLSEQRQTRGMSSHGTPSLAAGTVGDWTSRNFRCVVVIEKFGLDFHTEADLSLEEACGRHGADPAVVLAELEAAAAKRAPVERDWDAMPVRELIAHIIARHHEYLKLELPRLRARLDRMASRHGERDGALLTRLHAVYCELQADLEGHLHKEEMILFPVIERYEVTAKLGHAMPPVPFGTVMNPIGVMEREHDAVKELLARMREITRDYVPADYACANFRGVFASLEELEGDLFEHIRLENEILHPRAAAIEKSLRG
jgi:regulator of cell morphogenesis and NO signaling